jgi:hypothetical protein
MHRVLMPALLLIPLLAPGLGRADDAKAQAGRAQRMPVAKLATETASLLRRAGPDQPWQIVKQGEMLFSGDTILGGAGAAFETLNGAVRVTLLGDMSGLSPYPIVETAVVLQPNTERDLDFTLDRGRVDVTSHKKKGPARVVVHVAGHAGELTLPEAGSRVALEIYGSWPKGAKFHKDQNPRESPVIALIVLALKGQADIRFGGNERVLRAPPGPAMLVLDDLDQAFPSPVRLEQLPPWATDQPVTDRATKLKATVAKLRQLATAGSIDTAITGLLNSGDPFERRLAVNLLAALDELPRLGQVLREAKSPDVWDDAVLALRHYIGRGAGSDLKLYQALVKDGKYPPGEAEIVLNLLHDFSDEELARPETYEALLDYLESDRPAVRALAHWHLVRLVPVGAGIKFNPMASKEEREKAAKEWRKLIPRGKVPARVPAREK